MGEVNYDYLGGHLLMRNYQFSAGDPVIVEISPGRKNRGTVSQVNYNTGFGVVILGNGEELVVPLSNVTPENELFY